MRDHLRQCIVNGVIEHASRITKPIKVLRQSEDNSDDIWMTNIVDRYVARPTTSDFETICLAQFASNYRILNRTSANSATKEDSLNGNKIYKLSNNKGTITKRKIPAVDR